MIRKVRHYLKEKKELIISFHANANYMSPGGFVFDDSINYLVKDDPETKQKALKFLQREYYRKTFIRFFVYVMRKTLFRGTITNRQTVNKIERFSGSVYLPVGSSHGYKDKKIFDLLENKVLTIFTEKADLDSVLSNYEYFNEYFKLPTILWSDDQELLILEELITSVPKNTWEKDDYLFVITEVFETYYEYFSSCISRHPFSHTTVAELIDSFPEDLKWPIYKEQINNELVNLKIPKLNLHGDLWSANTLLTKLDKKQITYIDWEFSRELPFFYDFFNMMWLEVYMNNNDVYIEKYVHGDFDSQLIQIFSLFNLPFKAENRLAYFCIFFFIFYKERLLYFEANDRLTYINEFKRLLEKISTKKQVLITS